MKPQRATRVTAAHLGAEEERHPFSPRYDWDALPRQETPGPEFFRGLIIGALVEAALLVGLLGLFAWLWW